jgi:pimeloyl-ACP methyl ester carboxylesterase
MRLDLNIQRQGSGRPVVFLHGFLLDSSIWKNINLPNDRFESVFIDLPGHGLSKSCIPNEFSIQEYAMQIDEVLKDLNILEYELIGHSMGGYIGLELLELNPLITKFTLLHSNTWEDSLERKKNRDRVGAVVQKNCRLFLQESIPLLFHKPKEHKDTIQNSIERALQMSPESIIHSAQSMKNRTDKSAVIEKYKEKCHFIQGEFDQLIPLDEAILSWKGKGENFKIIKEAGHMSMFEQVDVLREILLS